ncbi:MAG: tetratricopeptide repeat protein, partial [Candidatus Methylomirabilia bacterium]
RLGASWRQWITPEARKVWMEKVPYVLLGVAGGGMALYAVSANSFLTPFARYPLFPDRVLMVLYSLWFYLWKTVSPLGLSPLYELPVRVNPLDPRFVVSAIAVGVITGGLLLMRRRWPAGLAVWAYYGVMLAPVSGLVHAGHQLTHDRYSYLSCLGWALLVGAGACAVIRAGANGTLRPAFTRLAAGAAAVWFLGLAALTWQQVQVWRDTEVLWQYAIEVNPECAICQSNLGTFLVNHGYTRPAIGHLEEAAALRQERTPHGSLGLALLNAGRLPGAVEQLKLAVERDPADVSHRNNLAVALLLQGAPEEAMVHLGEVIRLDPEHFQGRLNLGVALAYLGRPAEALGHFRRASELNPESALAHFELARAYLVLGKAAAAREEYEIVKRLDPQRARQLSPLLNSSRTDSGVGPLSAQGRAPRSSRARDHRE